MEVVIQEMSMSANIRLHTAAIENFIETLKIHHYQRERTPNIDFHDFNQAIKSISNSPGNTIHLPTANSLPGPSDFIQHNVIRNLRPNDNGNGLIRDASIKGLQAYIIQ